MPTLKTSYATFPIRFQACFDLLEPGWRTRKFLVAYSGGLDSTALLKVLISILGPDQIAVAHLNHELRGVAADRDQEFAAKVATELGTTFFTASRNVTALAHRRHQGLEEAARYARYHFLGQAAHKWGAGAILTAHQADDQAETMLMNFIKGTGTSGLAGLRARRPVPGTKGLEILRPLLFFNRAELRDWLVAIKQPWVEDESNLNLRFRRNQVRHEIMPLLKRLNPQLLQSLGRSAMILQAEEDYWQSHLLDLWPLVIIEATASIITLDRSRLTTLTTAEGRRLIYTAFAHLRKDRKPEGEPVAFATVNMTWELSMTNHTKGLDLPGGFRVEANPNYLRLSQASRLTGS
ncbi:MAG: hypothetical protein AMR96_00065 [Candidatus Adiutrix intracellularis]|jgi:tRNA(Ile)-lysidine synthase|nr:MAG: hypothetical protein AMR96_00065 [Candidatus Adiutrix intracellularis]MDR2827429.1 tRNA lysidine(34) synthetase TilS [Candidatus Adiutrix intracellularis]